MELVCPAGNVVSLKATLDAGADAVYLGFRDATNARNFEGLNFDEQGMHDGIAYAHARGRKIFLALNTYPQPAGWPVWQAAVDRAATLGLDALIYDKRTTVTTAIYVSVRAVLGNFLVFNCLEDSARQRSHLLNTATTPAAAHATHHGLRELCALPARISNDQLTNH